MAKKSKNSNEKTKKPIFKKWWFWLLLLILVAGIAGSMGGDKSDTTKKDDTKTADSKEKTAENKTKKEDTSNELFTSFSEITVGDLLNGAEGGATYDSIVATFGEPSMSSDSELEGVTTKMATWSGLKGGSMMSTLVIMFSNDKVVSKAITGLKVAKHDKVTLEQFNAVPTDGSFTYESAVEQFGEADSHSITLVNGVTTDLAVWSTNVEGDLGANFNLTFSDSTATAKAQFGLK